MADATNAGAPEATGAVRRPIEKHGLGLFPTVLLLIAVALAAAFIAEELGLYALPAVGGAPLWALEAAFKASGIVVLALIALIWTSGWDRLLVLALAFSAVGDVALAWEPGQLLAGMAAFGVGHLFYVALFARRLARDGMSQTGVLSGTALVLAGAFMMSWLYQAMGDMALPSLGYMVVLFAMAVLALLARGSILTPIGAVSFVLSDTMIAIGLYKPHVAIPPGAVWVTYVAAQALILVGILSTARRD